MAINLLPRAAPPHGRLFPLSAEETTQMEAYISEVLDQGFIQPSTSTALAGFFCAKKKEGTLRLCIDYRGLNKITIKDLYPLPLASHALESLCRVSIFTRLKLSRA